MNTTMGNKLKTFIEYVSAEIKFDPTFVTLRISQTDLLPIFLPSDCFHDL